MKYRIGVLCSGLLGLNCLKYISQIKEIQFVFTDSNSSSIVEYAQMNKIPLFIGNPRNQKAVNFLSQFKTDIILSINYLFIVQQEIINHPKLYAINFHGSLLPKYRGRTPHVWSIINGEKETGITAHKMEEGCDTGDILLQYTIEIQPLFTGSDILNIYNEKYPQMIYEILDYIDKNTLKSFKQNEENATYFGKRTPDDGQINWNWQKERIYNWIRAQSDPYPGAYSYVNNKKVIIDKISFTDYGFRNEMPNGLILKSKPEILVKTPNGVVKLEKIRNENNILFKEHNQLLYK